MITNNSNMPLDFLLTSNLPPYEPTELNFSLSRSSLRVFNTLHIDANNQVRVFVHFCPHPPAGSAESSRIDTPPHPKEVKIFVTCRVIKDFQQTIQLLANCRYPQMNVCLLFLPPSHKRAAFSFTFQDLINSAFFLPIHIQVSTLNVVFTGKVVLRDAPVQPSQSHNLPSPNLPLPLPSPNQTTLSTSQNAPLGKKIDIEFQVHNKEIVLSNNFDAMLKYPSPLTVHSLFFFMR